MGAFKNYSGRLPDHNRLGDWNWFCFGVQCTFLRSDT